MLARGVSTHTLHVLQYALLTITHLCARYVLDDVMKLAPHYDVDDDGFITFDEYRKRAIAEDIEGE